MVAGPEATRFLGRLKSAGGHKPIDERVEPGAGAGAMHHDLVAVEPPHHVEVDHGGGVGQRHRSVRRVVGAAEQAPFLAREGHEEDRPRKRPLLLEPPRHLDKQGRAAGVVVGAVMHGVLTRCRGIGAAVAEVVVVGAEHHGLGFRRPLPGGGIDAALRPAHARQDRHHVPALGLGPFDRRLALDPPARERAALWLERVVDPLLDGVEIPAERRLHDVVDQRPAEVHDRHRTVLGAVAGAGEGHQRVAVRVGVVAKDDAPGLVLRRIGHLAGQRRILRCLVAVEHAMWVVLLRLLSQHHDAGPLGGATLLGGRERRVVVVVLRGGGDAVAGEDQRQVKPP